MTVTTEEVLRIAALARLAVGAQEAERFTAQLNGILAHVEELRSAEREEGTGGAAPAGQASPAPAASALREDRTGPDPLARPPAALAPRWEAGFFIVPRLAALDAEAAADANGAERTG